MKKLIRIILFLILISTFVSCAPKSCPTYTKYKVKEKAYGMSALQNYHSPKDYKYLIRWKNLSDMSGKLSLVILNIGNVFTALLKKNGMLYFKE